MKAEQSEAAGEVGVKAPSPFSKINPRLQIAWDATSLYALQFCPRYYFLTILEGWRTTSVDLVFGLLYHAALEIGDRVWASGGSLLEAQWASFEAVLINSGKYSLDPDVVPCGEKTWVPWGGRYEKLWHCTHNPGAGKKKCKFAKAKQWHSGPAPSLCGAMLPFDVRSKVPAGATCGSPIEEQWIWVPGDSAKNRETLIRAVVWYWEDLLETPPEKLVRPYVFPDGTQAIELSFRLPLGWFARCLVDSEPPEDPEEFILCGHMDGLATFGPDVFVKERKSTKSALTKWYWGGFAPNIQISTYDLAGLLLYPQLKIKGVLLEACQTLTGGAKFGRQLLYQSDPLREEFLSELRWWIGQAEEMARTGVYPMNRAVCRMCKMKDICRKDPSVREGFLKADFEKAPWNPLEVR